MGQKGYTIFKKDFNDGELNKIRTDLTVKPFAPPNSIQKPVKFPIYRESSKKMYVPRMYGRQEFGIETENKLSEGDDIDLDFKGSLRDYQENIVSSYIKGVHKDNIGCGLLEVPCGRGKTICALNIISKLSKKTLVIVHKEFLLNQWIERIEQSLPMPVLDAFKDQQ